MGRKEKSTSKGWMSTAAIFGWSARIASNGKSPTKTMILKKISIVWRASTLTAIALPWAECLSRRPGLPACSEQWWLDRGTPGRGRARQSADEVVAGRSSHRAVRSPFRTASCQGSRVRTTGSTSRGWQFPAIGPSWVCRDRSSGAGPWSSSSVVDSSERPVQSGGSRDARRPPETLLATGRSRRSRHRHSRQGFMFWPARRWTSTGLCSSVAGGMRWIRRRTLSLGQRI